ncbi:MAG: hypothetical protein ACYC06_05125 [Ilumatobacteraceae bacterium]
MPELSRRQLLIGALGTLGLGATTQLISSCSSVTDAARKTVSPGLPDDVQLVQRFPGLLSPGSVRMPLSLANRQGLLTVDDDPQPDVLTAQLLNADTGEVVIDSLSAAKHSNGLTIAYWPFRAEIAKPGIYSLVVDGGPAGGVAIQILEANQVLVPKIGTLLPGFDTPTFDNHRGVEPICTLTPEPCPFHNITLNEALALGKPIAYLVGTPAFCSTGSCAPALEGLITSSKQFGEAITYIHAEIYIDNSATTVAPAVGALNMTYEPALFITDKQSAVTDRLDGVFDADEIVERLSALVL